MKIALAITGFPRMFDDERLYEPVKRFILDRYDVTTFAAIYEPGIEREYERAVWPYVNRSYFRYDFIKDFSRRYHPVGWMDVKVFVDELPRLIKESEDIPRSTGRTYAHRGIYSQVETWAKTADLIRQSGQQFDLVMKYRTDVLIHDFQPNMEAIAQSNTLFVSNDNAMGWHVGSHGECGGPGGICETLWICRPDVHFRFTEGLFANLKMYAKSINSCHAESLAGEHIRHDGIEVLTFPCKLSFPDVLELWPNVEYDC